MREIVSDPKLVARCGLYCGACGAYLKEKCPGCHENKKATWCKVRSCCAQNGLACCAECQKSPNPKDCKKFNNVVARLFGLVFRSDRAACVAQVRKLGLQGHADEMAKKRQQTIRP